MYGSAAPAPQLEPEGEQPEPEQPGEKPAASKVAPRQESLFERPKVIPFESIAAGRVARDRAMRAQRQKTARAQAATAPAPRPDQQNLDFRRRPPRPQTVHDEAPIAPPGLRLRAAAVDLLVYALALGTSVAMARLAGGDFGWSRGGQALPAAAAGAMFVFYHLFWSILGSEPPGQRLLRIRVVTFDGTPPNWQVRLFRTAATGLSILSAGLGLVWALVDEERLTWHDHISKTFPSPYDPHPRTFHRK